MAEYMDKEAFKKSVEERYCKPCKAEGKDYNGCLCRACWVDDMLDEVDCFQPAANVASVVHAQWIEDHDYLKCPECGVMVKRDFTFFDIGDWNFCPNCGTNLDLEE